MCKAVFVDENRSLLYKKVPKMTSHPQVQSAIVLQLLYNYE